MCAPFVRRESPTQKGDAESHVQRQASGQHCLYFGLFGDSTCACVFFRMEMCSHVSGIRAHMQKYSLPPYWQQQACNNGANRDHEFLVLHVQSLLFPTHAHTVSHLHCCIDPRIESPLDRCLGQHMPCRGGRISISPRVIFRIANFS